VSPLLQILLFTIRRNRTSTHIFETTLAIAETLSIPLVVGYGGEHDKFCRDLELLVTRTNSKNRFVANANFLSRVLIGLDPEVEFTLILSDDDLYTTNYITSVHETLSRLTSQASLLVPTLYPGITVSDTLARRPTAIDHESPAYRILAAIKQYEIVCCAFYATHRTRTIIDWARVYANRVLVPAFADQMLVLRSCLTGPMHVTHELTAFVRDDSNWGDMLNCTINDNKTFDSPQQTLFAECLYLMDTLDLVSEFNVDPEIIRPFALVKINHLLRSLNERSAILNVPINEQLKAIYMHFHQLNHLLASNKLQIVDFRKVLSICWNELAL
jgi:hypothetical protein